MLPKSLFAIFNSSYEYLAVQYIHALILLAAMLAITSTPIDWYDVITAQATIHD